MTQAQLIHQRQQQQQQQQQELYRQNYQQFSSQQSVVNSHGGVGPQTTPSNSSENIGTFPGSTSMMLNQGVPPNAVAPPPYGSQPREGTGPVGKWPTNAPPPVSSANSTPNCQPARQDGSADNPLSSPDDKNDQQEDTELVRNLLSDTSEGNEDPAVSHTRTSSPLVSPSIQHQGISSQSNPPQLTSPQEEPTLPPPLTSPTQNVKFHVFLQKHVNIMVLLKIWLTCTYMYVFVCI